jgi:hypothetical protein
VTKESRHCHKCAERERLDRIAQAQLMCLRIPGVLDVLVPTDGMTREQKVGFASEVLRIAVCSDGALT